MRDALYEETIEADVCVVGGGMAGVCAALAAARNGARTVIIQDRPVFGGNASSEVRMWICGAHGKHNKETGILEEIQLENCYRNPELNYATWDHVLWGKLAHQPRLRVLLNTSCVAAQVSDRRIASVRAWQLTSQTWITVHAKIFVDCSGDSILAPTSGAEVRRGREARADFDEDIEPSQGDAKTMGNSILIQLRRTETAQTFVPQPWAYVFERPEDLPHRLHGVNGTNFWWLELGGLDDTIRDAEKIRDDLLKAAYGVWDYIKNRAPERDQAANWALEWIGSLPGKRENRRYVGAHTLTQNDIRGGGQFPDVVAYGGWTMDDHHPAGLLYPGKPTVFHPAPCPYGIPYRCLYAVGIENLMFAGRNISTTHAALSSTRVMGTCSLLGQAAGTAAALAVQHGRLPAGLFPQLIPELQQMLLDDDVWLPAQPRTPAALTASATLTGDGQDAALLIDGCDRDRDEAVHAWRGQAGDELTWRWPSPVNVGAVRAVFDSNLEDVKRMPCSYPVRHGGSLVPPQLLRRFRVETLNAAGDWEIVQQVTENYQRLVRLPINRQTAGLRLVPEATWGAADVRIFAFEPTTGNAEKIPPAPSSGTFRDLVATVPAADLQPPENQGESHHTPRAPGA